MNTPSHTEIFKMYGPLGSVIGEMSTSGGLTWLNSTLALVDVPGMQKRMYTATEEFLGKEMHTHLAQSMQEVAKEKRHAVAMHSFHQRIPSITMLRDGSWSKRSHKHSYNTTLRVELL